MRLFHIIDFRLEKFLNFKHLDDETSFRLNTKTRKSQKSLEYAIFSYQWVEKVENEILFINIFIDVHQNIKDWFKIIKNRKITKTHNIEWIWINTCCIDKRNNTKLFENFNLMYIYYARVKECYAYLYDVV